MAARCRTLTVLLLALAGCRPTATTHDAGPPVTRPATAADLPHALRLTGAGLTLELRVSPLANLVYHLDCLAGLVTCDQASIRELWTGSLGWTAADDEALARWRSLTGRYRQSITLGEPAPAPYPFGAVGIDLGGKLRAASLLSADLDAYSEKLSLLMSTRDRQQALDLVARFEPRFLGWWSRTAARAGEAFVRELADVIAAADLFAFAERAASFYDAGLDPGTVLLFHIMMKPTGGTVSTGKQLEQHAIVEVAEGESARERVDIVFHELFHYFHAAAGPESQRALFDGLAAADEAHAVAAYGLLNEAVATALGNGLVAELVSKAAAGTSAELYADPDIDAVARALLRTSHGWFAEGVTLTDPAFVRDYLAAVREGLGAGLDAPRHRLRNFALLLDDSDLDELIDVARATLSPRTLYATSPIDDPVSAEPLVQYPSLSGIVLVRHARLGQLARAALPIPRAVQATLEAAAERDRAFVYALDRGAGATIYIVAGRDPAALAEALAALARAPAPTGPFVLELPASG